MDSYDLGKCRTLADEIGDLESDGAVEAELEAIKARLAGRRESARGDHE